MSVIRVCFLGTPDFAATHLDALKQDARFHVVGVVTQPDRPAGRKMQLTPSSVKKRALEYGFPVLTPENLRKQPDVVEQIFAWQADVAVVVAFGQILAESFLNHFKFGAVNIHGSLLPKWRGAAPIQRSIEAGDSESGVCLQRMVKKLDAGPIIGERRVRLDQQITATDLYEQLAKLGCDLLRTDFVEYIEGKRVPVEQNEALVTLAAKIEKEESRLDFNLPAQRLHNKIRAFTMGPGTYCDFQGKRLKIHRSAVEDLTRGAVEDLTRSAVEPSTTAHAALPSQTAGRVFKITEQNLILTTGHGLLSLLEVQPESKARMSIQDFLKSIKLKEGDLFV